MAKLLNQSTSIDAKEVENGNKKYLEISLNIKFLTEGDTSDLLHDDGSINYNKIYAGLIDVMNAAGDREI
ncbi:Uncharacterised protein [Sphingobacterium multivorum]|uniref:hypothetical protein n=1 Tax=Sphingobacterium multivorum TaxID=28454 RepID=UPI000DF94BAD|nr:hypothetical protein [Sphingobacterium multivorum]QQT44911.1 hypothetical protein I6J00_24980 [Sphingobacterium multivorum]SUJ18338.1 Uncharacterised protein [Sphingobacterium multivorum]